MTADHKNTTEVSEDIDLLLLVERSLSFFRKYKWIFLIAILFGIALGLFGYFKIAKTYKSRLILHSFSLTNLEQMEIIANWADLLKKKEYDELANAFNCDQNIIRRMKRMKASEIQKVFAPNNPNGYYIDVIVSDNSILDELQKGIVYGLENSDYIKRRLATRRADLQEMIDKVKLEITKLELTKAQMENIISGKEKSSSSLIIDGSSINRQWIDMTERLLGYRQELKFTSAVQVLQGFSQFQKPVGPNLVPLLALGLILCLSIAYLIALYSSVTEKLKNRSRLQNRQ